MKLSGLIWLLTGLIIGVLTTGSAFAARPGEADDPLISRSYLEAGAAFQVVALDDDEKIRVAPGEEFILADGNIRLECPGDFLAYDLTKGKSYRNPRKVDHDHLMIFIGNSSVSVIGDGKAECLVRGMILD